MLQSSCLGKLCDPQKSNWCLFMSPLGTVGMRTTLSDTVTTFHITYTIYGYVQTHSHAHMHTHTSTVCDGCTHKRTRSSTHPRYNTHWAAVILRSGWAGMREEVARCPAVASQDNFPFVPPRVPLSVGQLGLKSSYLQTRDYHSFAFKSIMWSLCL